MTCYTGIDVSLRSICVVDDKGEIRMEAKVAAEIDAIVDRLRRLSSDVSRGFRPRVVRASCAPTPPHEAATRPLPVAWGAGRHRRAIAGHRRTYRMRRARFLYLAVVACTPIELSAVALSRSRCIRQITPPASNAS
jgi:hypothetical protein